MERSEETAGRAKNAEGRKEEPRWVRYWAPVFFSARVDQQRASEEEWEFEDKPREEDRREEQQKRKEEKKRGRSELNPDSKFKIPPNPAWRGPRVEGEKKAEKSSVPPKCPRGRLSPVLLPLFFVRKLFWNVGSLERFEDYGTIET